MLPDKKFKKISKRRFDSTINKWTYIKIELERLETIDGNKQRDLARELLNKVCNRCGICREFKYCSDCPFTRCFVPSSHLDGEEALEYYKKYGNPYSIIVFSIGEYNYKQAIHYIDILFNILGEFKRRGLVKEKLFDWRRWFKLKEKV